MTGFAARRGEAEGYSWSWDIRSVNARGLDLRLRVPDWIDGLEPACRTRITKSIARGSVTASLRIQHEDRDQRAALNQEHVTETLAMIADITKAADASGVTLAPVSAADVLAQRGVLDFAKEDEGEELKALRAGLLDDLEMLLSAFLDMRHSEGQALQSVLTAQITKVSALVHQAERCIEDRKTAMAETLRSQIARVLENADGVDDTRLMQELALLAVKSDVTEEIDRLKAHVTAAQDLLSSKGPIGRKFDFLTQEFNREANTLCSKAQSNDLTNVGLSLKAVIDQMREQVQNVE
jgi:uncharacterized protein (TIGR00255 family)